MRGKNPIRPPLPGDGSRLEVKTVFPTLQGEGPFAGQPAVFVRLGGCNLACDFCDTDFEDFAPMALDDLMPIVIDAAHDAEGILRRDLVVITGGEPLRQNIAPLCEALLVRGFRVQIETNGTLFRPLPERVAIVCSPKNTGKGYHPLREDLLKRAQALKFLVSRHHPWYREVAEVGQTRHAIPVYVQPMDEYDDMKNHENLAYAVALAQTNGYRLSLQIHKLIGVP